MYLTELLTTQLLLANLLNRVNPGDTVGPESWPSRYISDSLRRNALKYRLITSLEAKQFE